MLRSVVPLRCGSGSMALIWLVDLDEGFRLRCAGEGARPTGRWRATDDLGTVHQLWAGGGGGDGNRWHQERWFRTALSPGARFLDLDVGDPSVPLISLDLRGGVRVHDLPSTVAVSEPDDLLEPPGQCHFCRRPGRPLCPSCRTELDDLSESRRGLPAMPDAVIPVAGRIGPVLGPDLVVVAIESWATTFTVELGWLGDQPAGWPEPGAPFARRWVAEDDAGATYVGHLGAGGGGRGTWFSDVTFVPGLASGAASLRLVMPGPAGAPLIEVNVDLDPHVH